MAQKLYFENTDFSNLDNEIAMRVAFSQIADEIDSKVKQQIVADYNNSDYIEKCRLMRENPIQKKGSKTAFRKTYSYPSIETYQFLEKLFMPLYGERWEFHPKVWDNYWVKIWRITN